MRSFDSRFLGKLVGVFSFAFSSFLFSPFFFCARVYTSSDTDTHYIRARHARISINILALKFIQTKV